MREELKPTRRIVMSEYKHSFTKEIQKMLDEGFEVEHLSCAMAGEMHRVDHMFIAILVRRAQ